MKKEILHCLLVVFTATVSWNTLAQGIIYEATSAPTGPTFTAEQMGNEVYAAGNARQIAQLQIGLSMQGYPGTSDFVLRLYDNNGPAGAPGSMLWQSAVFEDIPLSGPTQLVSFDVPNVLVPDVFTWTIQISNSTPVAVGVVGADSPSIGSSPPYCWFGYSGGWSAESLILSPNFMARVIAVPEPNICSFLVFIVILLILRFQTFGPFLNNNQYVNHKKVT